MTRVDGIIAVPATPFTDDNRIDEASLRRYARRVLGQGAVGFLAPAVAGEVDTLTEAEREQIVSILIEEAAGRVPVIGGATDHDPEARLRHVRRFIEMGCTGVLAYIKYENDASYEAAVRDLDRLSPGFLMIQDLDLGVAPLPVALIARLHREVPCFKWIKVETADRCRKISAIHQATGGSLAVGTAGPDLIELLDRGARAYLSTYTTGVYRAIWQAYRRNDREGAVSLYRRLLPCLTFMATHQNIQWRFTKALLQTDGVFSTTRIRTSAPESDAIEQQLIGELARYARDLAAEVTASGS
ncbi:MAG: dihydrodipicolinate synthase family protein [Opitutaceae bacterium]